MKIIRIVRKLAPLRIVFCPGACAALEFSSQNDNLKQSREKDIVEIEKCNKIKV